METLEQYFARPDTPMAGSPVGVLMVRILAKNPGMEYENARSKAHSLLALAAKSKRYRTPRVYSPEEEIASKARLAKAFRRVPAAA